METHEANTVLAIAISRIDGAHVLVLSEGTLNVSGAAKETSPIQVNICIVPK